jgi:hypothetical protein
MNGKLGSRGIKYRIDSFEFDNAIANDFSDYRIQTFSEYRRQSVDAVGNPSQRLTEISITFETLDGVGSCAYLLCTGVRRSDRAS